MGLQNNPATERLGYEIAKGIVEAAGYTVEKVMLTGSDLILERPIAANATNLEFPVLNTEQASTGPAFNTERRLKLQDAFIASAIGVFHELPSSATDTTFVPQTYPNDQVFSAGEVTGLNSLYNGYAQVTMNGTVLVPYWSLQKHRMVPQSQQSATITNAQVDMTQDPFVPLQPFTILQGTKNMIVQLFFPTGAATVGAFQRIRIHYRGYLAQNATLLKD